MIRFLRKWWIARQIDAANVDRLYWQAGMDAVSVRYLEYAAKRDAATRRANLLSQQITEIDYPTKHLKGLMQ